MFKKFFRKVRDTAKKIAPIAAPIAGMAFGPLAGAGIGALLGQYGGTKGALQGAMLGGIGGLMGGKGSLFGGSGGATAVPSTVAEAAASQNPLLLKNAIMNAPVQEAGGIAKLMGMLKNPYVQGGLLAATAGLMNKEEDDEERDEVEVGSQGQLGGMRVADIEYLPANVPIGPAGYAGYANGGIVALAEGGTPPPKNMDDYPRKNGNIAGPGTMTSDDIPAMLSDGEFVTKAVSVIGAGVREGADNIEDAREMGSDFFYKQQDELAKLGERLVNGN